MMQEIREFILPLRYVVKKIHPLTNIEDAATVVIHDKERTVYTCIPIYDYDISRMCVYITKTNDTPLMQLFLHLKDIKADIIFEVFYVGFSFKNEHGISLDLVEKRQITEYIQWSKPTYGEIYQLVLRRHEEIQRATDKIRNKNVTPQAHQK